MLKLTVFIFFKALKVTASKATKGNGVVDVSKLRWQLHGLYESLNGAIKFILNGKFVLNLQITKLQNMCANVI